MIMTKPERFNSFLPSTPVTDEMRDQIDSLAKENGVSMAHIVRLALSLFLREIARNPDIESQKDGQS